MTMYGDLVNALCYTAFLPVYLYLWMQDPSEAGRNVNITFAWTMVFSWYSYLKEVPSASVLACLGMTSSIASMNLYGWPHSGQIVVQPQFLWSLLIISGNTKLTLVYQTGMAFIVLIMAVFVCVFSPLVRVAEELPFLLCFTVVHIGIHYYLSKQKQDRFGFMSAQASCLVLAGSFAFYMSSELIKIVSLPGYATEGGYSVLRVGFFAVAGLSAAGAFRKEIHINQAQAERLVMVEHALQASETALAITDCDQRIIWWNTALERIAQGNDTNPSKLQGQLMGRVLKISPFDREALERSFHANETSVTSMTTLGRYMNVEVSKCPENKNPLNGKVSQEQFLVVLKDMTAEKEAAREAAVAQAMEESMQTLSHELRTPLLGIMGISSMLLRGTDLSQDAKDCMTMVMTSARLLLTLINNLLDVRKLDSNMLDSFSLTPISLRGSLQAALDFCRPCATISNVCLKLSDNGVILSKYFVESNSLRLQQVVINLLSNAIKYTSEGSDVSVSVSTMALDQVEVAVASAVQRGPDQPIWNEYTAMERREQQMAVISITDNGAGIQGKDMPNVFGKFTQLGSSPIRSLGGGVGSQANGTGLGLNLCAKFLLRMKGRIWVTNNIKSPGSTFSFALPLPLNAPSRSNSSSRLSVKASLPNQPKDTHNTDMAKYRILLVDDTIINLKVTARMLKSIGIQTVTTASNGKEALQHLDKEDYNLVVTDLQMPEMSGIELCAEIQKRASLPVKPTVIAFTADTTESVAKECYQVGMKSILYKPLTADQLDGFFENLAQGDAAQ